MKTNFNEVAFFDILRQRKIISGYEHQEINTILRTIIEESEALLKKLNERNDLKTSTLAYIEALSAQDPLAEKYLFAFAKVASNYLILINKINEYALTPEGEILLKDFKNGNLSSDPSDLLIQPVQRGPRHRLFLNEIKKQIRSEEIGKAIDDNNKFNLAILA